MTEYNPFVDWKNRTVQFGKTELRESRVTIKETTILIVRYDEEDEEEERHCLDLTIDVKKNKAVVL